jgi:hypothetical protein
LHHSTLGSRVMKKKKKKKGSTGLVEKDQGAGEGGKLVH